MEAILKNDRENSEDEGKNPQARKMGGKKFQASISVLLF